MEQRGGLGQCGAAGPQARAEKWSLIASVLPVRIAQTENSHLTGTALQILVDQDLTPSPL